MRIRTFLLWITCCLGILLVGYSGIWYLIINNDPSQFLAFTMLGVYAIVGSVIANEILVRQDKIISEMDYFEDKLLDKFPQLKR